MRMKLAPMLLLTAVRPALSVNWLQGLTATVWRLLLSHHRLQAAVLLWLRFLGQWSLVARGLTIGDVAYLPD